MTTLDRRAGSENQPSKRSIGLGWLVVGLLVIGGCWPVPAPGQTGRVEHPQAHLDACLEYLFADDPSSGARSGGRFGHRGAGRPRLGLRGSDAPRRRLGLRSLRAESSFPEAGSAAAETPAEAPSVRPGSGRTITATGATAEDLPWPDILGPYVDPFDLGRLQRRVDTWLGFDADDQSDKPHAPEIPEAVFFHLIRPLGALKYENEFNYFLGEFTRGAPTLQFLDYDYVFADWRAVRLTLVYEDGVLETLEPGYQRTLGVGPRGNWVHGFQILPLILLRERFVGGTALYIFGWKPEEQSPWSASVWVGANRVPRGAEVFGAPLPGPNGENAIAGFGSRRRLGAGQAGQGPEPPLPIIEQTVGIWRPVVSAHVWYTLSPSLSVGIETDTFWHHEFSEFLVLPHVNWHPTTHFFAQLGMGYYALDGQGQAAFMLRVALLNPTHRRSRPRDAEGPPAAAPTVSGPRFVSSFLR